MSIGGLTIDVDTIVVIATVSGIMFVLAGLRVLK